MRNKFNAQKIVTAEGVFDSHKEYERYLQQGFWSGAERSSSWTGRRYSR
jgi:hypothetical protein